MRIAFITASAAALFSTAVLGADQTATSSGNDPNEVICKRQHDSTGSRLGGHNLCLTRAQWDERRRNDQDMTQRSQLDSLHTRPPGG